MKTVFTSLIIFLLLGSHLFAQQEPIKLCAQVDKNNTEVDVNIYVSDFVNIGSVQFGIAWEASKYDFVSFDNVNPELASLAHATHEGDDVPDALSLLNIVWFDETGTTPRTLNDESILCTVRLSQKDVNVDGLIGIAPDEDFMIEFSNGDVDLVGHELEGPDCSVLAFSSLTSGLKDVEINELELSPNPFNQEITVTPNENEKGLFLVYSTTGKLVKQFNYNGEGTITLGLNDIDSGTYILTQKSENGVIIGQSKIVKL